MRRKKEIEVDVCDFCNEKDAWYACEGCKKAICYDCAKTITKEYSPFVYCTGGNELRLCLECDTKWMTKPTGIFADFKALEMLRAEYKSFYSEFEKKQKLAEERVKSFEPYRLE